MNGEITHDNQQIARTFVLAAFEKKHLAQQIDTLYESVDHLGAALDVESRQILFENTSEQMKKMGARLTQLERQLNEMLPDFLAISNSFEVVSATTAKSLDTTQSFGQTGSDTPPTTRDSKVLPQPLSVAQVAPEKPTLIAQEPAPLLDENSEGYQFEDDEDIELPDEADLVASPAGALTTTAPTPDAEQVMIAEEQTGRQMDPSDVTEPVLFKKTDDGEDVLADEYRPSEDDPQDSNNAQKVPVNPKATIRYGSEMPDGVQAQGDTDDSSADLANLLEPEDSPSMATNERDTTANESPSNLDARDKNILFWKNSSNVEPDGFSAEEMAPSPTQIPQRTTFVLSRIPSLLPRDANAIMAGDISLESALNDAMESAPNDPMESAPEDPMESAPEDPMESAPEDPMGDDLDHIRDYDDTMDNTLDAEALDELTDASDIDTSFSEALDSADATSSAQLNAMEQELYNMLDMQPTESGGEPPQEVMQTTADAVSDIVSDDINTDNPADEEQN